MNVKVAEDDGFCTAANIARGIVWAVDNGADIINISLVVTSPSPVLEDAVNYAWKKGAIVVAAAGNMFTPRPMYPAACSNAIAVTATAMQDAVPAWANRGEWVDMAAPGVNIYSTMPGDDSAWESGTSMSAALVSGLAALLYTIATDTNGDGNINDEVRAAIEKGTDVINIDGTGKGRINAFKSLTLMPGAN